MFTQILPILTSHHKGNFPSFITMDNQNYRNNTNLKLPFRKVSFEQNLQGRGIIPRGS